MGGRCHLSDSSFHLWRQLLKWGQVWDSLQPALFFPGGRHWPVWTISVETAHLLPSSESPPWELVPLPDPQNRDEGSGVGFCMLTSVIGDSWAHSDLRNIGLRGLGFGMGSSALIIEIAVPFIRYLLHVGHFLTSLIFTTTTLQSRYYYSNCTEEKTETQSN